MCVANGDIDLFVASMRLTQKAMRRFVKAAQRAGVCEMRMTKPGYVILGRPVDKTRFSTPQ